MALDFSLLKDRLGVADTFQSSDLIQTVATSSSSPPELQKLNGAKAHPDLVTTTCKALVLNSSSTKHSRNEKDTPHCDSHMALCP